MSADRVVLIDWDESHVDFADLDLVLPHNAARLEESTYDIAQQASAAWEAAVCWDDEYSVRRLAQVRAVRDRVYQPGAAAATSNDNPSAELC